LAIPAGKCTGTKDEQGPWGEIANRWRRRKEGKGKKRRAEANERVAKKTKK
jgi:hypothetical protein